MISLGTITWVLGVVSLEQLLGLCSGNETRPTVLVCLLPSGLLQYSSHFSRIVPTETVEWICVLCAACIHICSLSLHACALTHTQTLECCTCTCTHSHGHTLIILLTSICMQSLLKVHCVLSPTPLSLVMYLHACTVGLVAVHCTHGLNRTGYLVSR